MGTRATNHTLVQYCEVDNGVDFEYEVKSNCLKENIIIHERRDAYEFVFCMTLCNLNPEIDEKKRVIKLKKANGNEQFVIPTPFMTDANGMSSDSVYYNLSKIDDNKYLFTIKADAEWINSASTVLPVTVDPVLEYKNGYATLTYENSKSGYNGIAVGCDGNSIWTSELTADISAIPSNARIVSAELELEQLQATGDYYIRFNRT